MDLGNAALSWYRLCRLHRGVCTGGFSGLASPPTVKRESKSEYAAKEHANLTCLHTLRHRSPGPGMRLATRRRIAGTPEPRT